MYFPLHSRYNGEFMCYLYGSCLFLFLLSGKFIHVVLFATAVFFMYLLYFVVHIRYVRNAIREVRYSQEDFHRTIEKLILLCPMDHEIQECIICMEDFTVPNPPFSLRCSCKDQFYHKDCITHWLLKAATCPICRSDLKSKSGEIDF